MKETYWQENKTKKKKKKMIENDEIEKVCAKYSGRQI